MFPVVAAVRPQVDVRGPRVALLPYGRLFRHAVVPLGVVATACALAAALLNAVFGVCLGCLLYLRALRVARRPWTTTQ